VKSIIRISTIVGILVMLGMGASAMIRELPLPELVNQSVAIVLAVVTEKIDKPAPKGGCPSVVTHFRVERTLKGELAASATFEIEALGTIKGDAKYEDEPRFPDVGAKVLLMLEKGKDGKWLVANCVQGVWPIDAKTGKPAGMGTGKSVANVEAEIAKQKKTPLTASGSKNLGEQL
jgi:hypothetical protein